MHKGYSAIALCCAALAAAGCGASHATTTRGEGPASPAVFKTDVNALCQTAKTASGNNLDKAAAVLSQALPQFKAITAPPAQQAAYSQFLAHLDALAAAVKNRDLGAAQAEAGKLAAVARQLHVSECVF
jgi:hypothetical protein